MTASTTYGEEDWPEVAHIDSTIVRKQIGGDAQLFLRLLNELVESYSINVIPVVNDDRTNRRFSDRMHKLKGAAASLGATRICEFAAQTEAAIAACDDETIWRLVEIIQAELAALRDALAVLAQRRSTQSVPKLPARHVEYPPNLDNMRELAQSLRSQSLASVRRFDAMEAEVRRLAGAGFADVLRNHVDHLRFCAAADILDRYITRAMA